MGAPFTEASVVGYNDNPPPDDGSETEENRVKWETIKEKLDDPLKTALEADITNTQAAFGKIIGGAGVVSSGINATVGAVDQGKLYRATGDGITITTPDATSVGSPFWFGFLNNAATAVTLEGNGSQTINGAANLVIPPNGGGIVATDGSNWFMVGISGVPAGKQLQYGDIINGTITEANGSNAVTFALKTLAGADPSSTDPVLLCFRSATAATGNYNFQVVSAALSLTIPSTATMGVVSGVAFDLVIALFNDAGTIRMGAINPFQKGTLYYDLTQTPPIVSSTAVGTGADLAKTWYTNGSGVTTRAYLILAVANYASGLVTAGTWNVSPTTLQLFGHGITLPSVAKKSDVGWQLIETIVASGAATVDFETGIDNTYDRYVIVGSSIKVANDDVAVNVRVKNASGFQSDGTDYYWTNIVNTNGAASAAADASDSEITMTLDSAGTRLGNASGECMDFELRFDDPEDATKFHSLYYEGTYDLANGTGSSFQGVGRYLTIEAITGIRFLAGSGNISGTFRLYGVKK